jgi:NADPH:quinone reductase-like Zn-dependent oxidoreductase
LARAAGATVIAITSSEEKVELLKSLGAKHVINYMKNPDWGPMAKDLSENGNGIDNVLDVVGGKTLLQSLKSVKLGGVVTVMGVLDGFNPTEWPSILEVFSHMCTVRAIAVGNKSHFQDLVKAIDANSIKPVLDKTVFGFDDMKAAYEYLVSLNLFGRLDCRAKLTIVIVEQEAYWKGHR